jgi:hypothetical protein
MKGMTFTTMGVIPSLVMLDFLKKILYVFFTHKNLLHYRGGPGLGHPFFFSTNNLQKSGFDLTVIPR